jgi:hypothetical protein
VPELVDPVAERRVLTALPPKPPPEPSYIILGPGRLGFMSGPPAPFDGPRATRRWPVRRWPRRAIP